MLRNRHQPSAYGEVVVQCYEETANWGEFVVVVSEWELYVDFYPFRTIRHYVVGLDGEYQLRMAVVVTARFTHVTQAMTVAVTGIQSILIIIIQISLEENACVRGI